MLNAVIFDIDGTLANLDHRVHHVKDGKKRWDMFFAEMHNDTIIAPVKNMLDILFNDGYYIILVSGRGEEYRQVTEQWLDANSVHYYSLFMRKARGYRSDVIVKSEIYDMYIAPEFSVDFVFDDRPSVIRMWREEKGLFVFDVGKGIDF